MEKTGLILGKVGSGLGIVSPIFLLVILVWNYAHHRDSKMAGILLIVAGIGFAFTCGLDYFVATPLLLAAGILLLLQRGKAYV